MSDKKFDSSYLMPEAHLTKEQEIARGSWQYRAIMHQSGNQTPLGCLIIALVGKMASNPPRIVSSGIIDKNGNVLCMAELRRGDNKSLRRLSSVQEMTDRLSELADVLKFNDEDRIALFSACKKWIWKDMRPDTTLHFSKGKFEQQEMKK